MKIGVAMSGCGINGIAAFAALDELAKQGMEICMLSVCGIPAATSLLYAHQDDFDKCYDIARSLADGGQDIRTAVEELSASVDAGKPANFPVIVSCADLAGDKVVAFSNELGFRTRNLSSELLSPLDTLCGTACPYLGRQVHDWKDMKLCDYGLLYGIPLYPMGIAQCKRVISMAFMPEKPSTPCEAALARMISGSAGKSNIHIGINSGPALDARPDMDELVEFVRGEIRGRMPAIFDAVLF